MKSVVMVSSLLWHSSSAFVSSGSNASLRRDVATESRLDASFVQDKRPRTTSSTCLQVSTLVEPPDTMTTDPDNTKEELLRLIRTEDQDSLPTNSIFQSLVSTLSEIYDETDMDARYSTWPYSYNGEWQNEHSPAFGGRLGFNSKGEPKYNLGTLTFFQFPQSVNGITCSVQKMRQSAQFVGVTVPQQAEEELFHPECSESMVPPSLLDDVKANPSQLASSVLDTYFTTNEGVKGIIRMQSYVFPHPSIPNRFETWFVGGKCIPQANQDVAKWQELFGEQTDDSVTNTATPTGTNNNKSIMSSITKSIKILFGEETKKKAETLSFTLPAAIIAHQDVAYLDQDLRITVGNRGTNIIFSRQDDENE